MKCNVTVTPVRGKPAVYSDVEFKDGSTIVQVLDSIKVAAGRNFHIFNGGEPAKLSERVHDGANISLSERAAGS